MVCWCLREAEPLAESGQSSKCPAKEQPRGAGSEFQTGLPTKGRRLYYMSVSRERSVRLSEESGRILAGDRSSRRTPALHPFRSLLDATPSATGAVGRRTDELRRVVTAERPAGDHPGAERAAGAVWSAASPQRCWKSSMTNGRRCASSKQPAARPARKNSVKPPTSSS